MLERTRSRGATRAQQVVFVSPQAQWNGNGSRDPPVGRRNNAGRKKVWVARRERPPGARKISDNHRCGVPRTQGKKSRDRECIGTILGTCRVRVRLSYPWWCGAQEQKSRPDRGLGGRLAAVSVGAAPRRNESRNGALYACFTVHIWPIPRGTSERESKAPLSIIKIIG